MGVRSPSTVTMAVLERSSSPTAATVAALIALASVAAVAGEVYFQEKFDGKLTPGSHPSLHGFWIS